MTRILIIGHSHVAALNRAWERDWSDFPDIDVQIVNLHPSGRLSRGVKDGKPETDSEEQASTPASIRKTLLAELDNVSLDADLTVLCMRGNEHNIIGLSPIPAANPSISPDGSLQPAVNGAAEQFAAPVAPQGHMGLAEWVGRTYIGWLDDIVPRCTGRLVILLPPPPVQSNERIRKFPGPFALALSRGEIMPPEFRLSLWRKQCTAIRAVAASYRLEMLELPKTVFSSTGFLAEDCLGNDPTHGNTEYGRRVMNTIIAHLDTPARAGQEQTDRPSRHPYAALPDYAFWKQAVSEVPQGELDPVTAVPFKIGARDKVATAGSCFAQHISKRLRAGGFHFLVTEATTGDGNAEARGFYDFSARYGNIYTARQLLQLFDRVFGYFWPHDRVWVRPAGGFCDPFRPRIEPDGFPSEESLVKDRREHFAAVRRMFKQLDVFVFTLGLTECWVSRLDGAVYPVAPGVAGGVFDAKRYEFLNFSVAEVTADLRLFLKKLRLVNPKARVILTVSPVPLAATAQDRHVLVSTTYSKSVLRVAAEEIASTHRHVCYFPSYEIITGSHAGGAYFGRDRRSVTEAGVDHVMRVFMARMTEGGAVAQLAESNQAAAQDAYAEMEALAEAACDEELLMR